MLTFIIDKKTGKPNDLYISPVKDYLKKYSKWMQNYQSSHLKGKVFLKSLVIPVNFFSGRYIRKEVLTYYVYSWKKAEI